MRLGMHSGGLPRKGEAAGVPGFLDGSPGTPSVSLDG